MFLIGTMRYLGLLRSIAALERSYEKLLKLARISGDTRHRTVHSRSTTTATLHPPSLLQEGLEALDFGLCIHGVFADVCVCVCICMCVCVCVRACEDEKVNQKVNTR